MTETLSAGANTIAVEIHQASGGSSDIRFDMMLRGETSRVGGDNVSDPLFFAEPTILRARSYNTGNKEWSALNESFFTIEESRLTLPIWLSLNCITTPRIQPHHWNWPKVATATISNSSNF